MTDAQRTNTHQSDVARRSGAPEVIDDHLIALTAMFRMLGDVTRTRILFALLDVDELHVSAIAAVVEKPETSVSHALRLLRTAGIVRSRRVGRSIHYSVVDDHVREILIVSRRHLGLPRAEVTSDLWCREAPLEGCSPCPSRIRRSSATTSSGSP